jgi:hypothetical protein
MKQDKSLDFICLLIFLMQMATPGILDRPTGGLCFLPIFTAVPLTGKEAA